MRTLDEITTAVRRQDVITHEELIYAVCAYDVLMSKLEVEKNPVLLQEYFIAADSSPKKYIGWANDPINPEARAWHTAMIIKPEED